MVLKLVVVRANTRSPTSARAERRYGAQTRRRARQYALADIGACRRYCSYPASSADSSGDTNERNHDMRVSLLNVSRCKSAMGPVPERAPHAAPSIETPA
jgi:hypothetical protein